uniref:Cytochrome b561 domain-containing protein n=1 Tax=Globisporangium ultimum (strain ATCC 200006 / CBS 805.95 / DAOM BR144) TaxID=431595 RepID=K3X580_GLOUD
MELSFRALAHGLPLLILVLVGYWMGSGLTQYVSVGDVITEKDLSGFSWAHADGRVFNWHPVFMTFGFVVCSSQAALAYISLPFSHDINKRIHLSLHTLGLVSAVTGAIAVFRFHNEHSITNLYSLHSWLGLLTVILFLGHYVVSFYVFFYPGAQQPVRAQVNPFHIGLGIGILGLVFLTACTGILEKLSFNASCNVTGTLNGNQVKGFMAADCVLGNTIGLLLAFTFATLAVTIWLSKHKPEPFLEGAESAPLISGGQKKDHYARG